MRKTSFRRRRRLKEHAERGWTDDYVVTSIAIRKRFSTKCTVSNGYAHVTSTFTACTPLQNTEPLTTLQHSLFEGRLHGIRSWSFLVSFYDSTSPQTTMATPTRTKITSEETRCAHAAVFVRSVVLLCVYGLRGADASVVLTALSNAP